jgi:hypothetical protein
VVKGEQKTSFRSCKVKETSTADDIVNKVEEKADEADNDYRAEEALGHECAEQGTYPRRESDRCCDAHTLKVTKGKQKDSNRLCIDVAKCHYLEDAKQCNKDTQLGPNECCDADCNKVTSGLQETSSRFCRTGEDKINDEKARLMGAMRDALRSKIVACNDESTADEVAGNINNSSMGTSAIKAAVSAAIADKMFMGCGAATDI